MNVPTGACICPTDIGHWCVRQQLPVRRCAHTLKHLLYLCADRRNHPSHRASITCLENEDIYAILRIAAVV